MSWNVQLGKAFPAREQHTRRRGGVNVLTWGASGTRVKWWKWGGGEVHMVGLETCDYVSHITGSGLNSRGETGFSAWV